jgi:hypothetical protein
MKRITITLFIALFYYSAIAQENTLLSGTLENGGYGAIFTKIGQINGETGVFMGGQGAWIINHRFGVGGKGYGIVNETKVKDLQNVKLEFGCWGGLVEYIVASDKLLHLNIHSMIGAGGVRYAIIDHKDEHDDIDYSEDGFFVLEPGLDLVLNVSKNFRIGAGVAYRYVNGVDYENLSNSDLSGMSGHIILKFGVF